MLNQLLSGNIPLSGPNQVTLSPLAALARILVLHGFPASSPAGGTPEVEPALVQDEPAIPDFAYLFHEEKSMMPATSELVLFLPQNETRPHPVRVVERSACKVKWYSIETWHENVRRWIDRDTAPKKDAALDKAREMPWLATVECE
ncbi:hypothetical protein [Paraburkholderia aromaticivorans]|uniref:hypothetical protein n=1 Tax=Paraburkholderia aromaticivorans TaxID=2026199 RepID=UPI0012FD0B1D|nr:hypothetical protein [Paraburkholderia aromaticivorans]